MEYLFNMGLAGSLMWILYLLIQRTAKGGLSDRWRYVMLKCSLVYYLVPIPFMKRIYCFVWQHMILTQETAEWFGVYTDEYRVLYDTQQLYVDRSLKWQLAAGGFLAGIAAVVFAYKLRKHQKQRKLLMICRNCAADGHYEESCRALQLSVGIRRDVTYIDSTPADQNGNTAFTIGIWKPVILYPAKRSHQEIKLILEHELHHVKNGDVLWRILLSTAEILHFYNPFVWFFAAEFERVSEMVCDSGVLHNKGERERKHYAKLLVQMAQEGPGYGEWSAGINSKKREMRERVEHVMRKDQKYLKGIVSAVLVGAAVLLNSFTAFAYDDVKVWVGPGEDPEAFFQMDMVFAPEETTVAGVDFCEDSVKYLSADVLYYTQFVNESGEICEVYDEAASVMASCTHEYVNGSLTTHQKDSSGGCTIVYYQAKRCSKCGATVREDEIYRVIFKVCTH